MSLESGTRLGPYEIISRIETAKTSELYRASDTRLKREVAVKVFDSPFSEGFERDARAIASLSHPNLCALHDVGHEEGMDFLVMEYLEGQTLAQRLEKGPLDLDEAIRIAIAIGNALDKIHREGLTHRALQPSKIMLTPAGPKLLGIRLAESGPSPDTSLHPNGLVPTGDADLPYTPPECLDGKDPDARSDIFAYGATVYEMVTGRRAFEGKSRAVLIASIATADSDPLTATRPEATPMLQHIIERCLAKDPEERWQTAHDMLVQLRWMAGGGGAGDSAPGQKIEKRIRIILAVAALLVIALAYPAARYWLGSAESELLQFRVPVRGLQPGWSLSPDGKTIALIARPNAGEPASLHIRPTDEVTFVKLTGTDDAAQTFWSPDSQHIGFVAGGRLKRVSVSGGAPKDICAVENFSGGAWNREGTILFGSDKGIYRVSAEGGVPATVTTVDEQETGHYWPGFLPDGQHFLYLAVSNDAAQRVVFIGKLGSKDKKKLMAAQSKAAYAAPGYIVFHREGTVFARPFDAGKLTLRGKELHLADEVVSPANGWGGFDVSQTGGLLYVQQRTGTSTTSVERFVLAQNLQWGWVDQSGRQLELAGKEGPYGQMDLSPDGKLIAVTRQDTASSGADIWIIDWQRAGVATRLTQDPASDFNPVWAPDSKHVAFTSTRKGNRDIYVVEHGSGVGKEIPLLESAGNEIVEDWSPDGKYIAYITPRKPNIYDIYAIPMGDGKPDGKPFPVVQGEFDKDEPQFSHDGKLLAYVSDRGEAGRYQVYVRTFPEGDQEIPITVDGGGVPRWRGDGKELYYLSPDGWVMAVEIKAGAQLAANIPRRMFRLPLMVPGLRRRALYQHIMEVTRDGRRFLLWVHNATSAESSGSTAVPQIPVITQGNLADLFGSMSPTATGPAGGAGPISDGLTLIQHWTSVLGKAEQ